MKELSDSEYYEYIHFKEYMEYSKWNNEYQTRHFSKVPESDIETWSIINKENEEMREMLTYVESNNLNGVKKLFESGHKISILKPEDGPYIHPAGYESKYSHSLEKAVSLNNLEITKYLFDNGVRTSSTHNLCLDAKGDIKEYLEETNNGPEFKIIINLIESNNSDAINEIEKIINVVKKQPYCIRCDSDYSKRKSSNYYNYLKKSIEVGNVNLVKYFGNLNDSSYKYMFEFAKTQEMKDHLRNLYIEYLKKDIMKNIENGYSVDCQFPNELRYFYDLKGIDIPKNLDKTEYLKLWSDGLTLAKSLRKNEVVNFLIRNGVTENKNEKSEKSDMEKMFDAVDSNDLDTIKKIFSKEPKIMSKVTYMRSGPGPEAKYSDVLIKAVETGKIDIVKYLYSNNVYTDHCQLLEKAIKEGHYEICKYLRSVHHRLENLNDINIAMDEIILGIANLDLEYIKDLLKKQDYRDDDYKIKIFDALKSYLDKMIKHIKKTEKELIFISPGKDIIDFFNETDEKVILDLFK
jgi:hypothetical protein